MPMETKEDSQPAVTTVLGFGWREAIEFGTAKVPGLEAFQRICGVLVTTHWRQHHEQNCVSNWTDSQLTKLREPFILVLKLTIYR